MKRRPKYILRSEQSADNNCCNGIGTGCVDATNVVSAIQNLASAGVKVFVVGLPGSEPYSEFLSDFADAGGRPTGTSTGYYAVSDINEVSNVFTEIFESLSCWVELPTSTAPRVFVDCAEVASTDGDGWRWSAGTLTLLGQTCEASLNSRVDLLLGCP